MFPQLPPYPPQGSPRAAAPVAKRDGQSKRAVLKAKAIAILDPHRIMAISTVRPEGWPQTTIVGYANLGLTLYFLIFRSSQKFSNIWRDDRASFAVGSEPRTLVDVEAAFVAGHAREITRGSAIKETSRSARRDSGPPRGLLESIVNPLPGAP